MKVAKGSNSFCTFRIPDPAQKIGRLSQSINCSEGEIGSKHGDREKEVVGGGQRISVHRVGHGRVRKEQL